MAVVDIPGALKAIRESGFSSPDAAHVWKELQVEPNLPNKLATMIDDDKQRINGKIDVAVENPEMKRRVKKHAQTYLASVVEGVLSSLRQSTRIQGITIDNVVSGGTPEEAQDKLSELLRHNKADTDLFPEIIRLAYNHGNVYTHEWDDVQVDPSTGAVLDSGMSTIEVISPDRALEVVDDQNRTLYYAWRWTMDDGRERMNIDRGFVLEKLFALKGTGVNPADWEPFLDDAPIVMQEDGVTPFLLPNNEGNLQLQREWPLVNVHGRFMTHHIRTSRRINRLHGEGAARCIYGHASSYATTRGIRQSILELAGSPYVAALMDPNPNSSSAGALTVGAAGSDFLNQRAENETPGTTPKVDLTKAGPGLEKASVKAGRIERIWADAIEIIKGEGVENFTKAEMAELSMMSFLSKVPKHEILPEAPEPASGLSKRADSAAKVDRIREMMTSIDGGLEDAIENLMYTVGFEVQCSVKWAQIYFIDPTEEETLKTGKADRLAKYAELPPVIRVKLLVEDGLSLEEAQEWSDAMDVMAQQQHQQQIEQLTLKSKQAQPGSDGKTPAPAKAGAPS